MFLLWSVVTELNHLLSSWHLYLWVGGLFILYPALALPLRDGLVATLMGGLLCDATTGARFGLHTLLFAAAHIVIFNLRDRIPRDETAGRVVIALFGNLGLFLVFSFLQVARFPDATAVWPRIICDLICSQIFLALITPWFVALQVRVLDVARPLAGFYNHSTD
jgi:hypothetical protein